MEERATRLTKVRGEREEDGDYYCQQSCCSSCSCSCCCLLLTCYSLRQKLTSRPPAVGVHSRGGVQQLQTAAGSRVENPASSCGSSSWAQQAQRSGASAEHSSQRQRGMRISRFFHRELCTGSSPESAAENRILPLTWRYAPSLGTCADLIVTTL